LYKKTYEKDDFGDPEKFSNNGGTKPNCGSTEWVAVILNALAHLMRDFIKSFIGDLKLSFIQANCMSFG